MDDQTGVGGVDGRGHLADELDPDREGVPRGAAGFGDRHAGDPLEGEVRAPVRRHSGVEELRDVRMAEGRQNVAFAAEAALHRAPGEVGVRQLEGDLAFVGAVAPGGEPDDPHAAASELAFEGVGADAVSGEDRELVVRRRRRGQPARSSRGVRPPSRPPSPRVRPSRRSSRRPRRGPRAGRAGAGAARRRAIRARPRRSDCGWSSARSSWRENSGQSSGGQGRRLMPEASSAAGASPSASRAARSGR